MQSGKIKWFSAVKGYGFISSPDASEDVFVHFSELQIDGFKTVRSDAEVTFDLLQTDKGPIALKVQINRSENEKGEPHDVVRLPAAPFKTGAAAPGRVTGR